MKSGRKPVKKAIKNKVVKLKIMGKTEKEILSVVPSISSSTVQNITKANKDLIQASKQKYIKLIDKATGGDKEQAKVLASILKAKQDVFNFKGQVVGNRPDYKIRLEAVKYIDKLKSREQQSIRQTQNNTFIAKDLDRYM